MKRLPFLVSFLAMATFAHAQMSKQQATAFVLDTIVGNRIDSVNVYMEPLVQTAAYYRLSPYDSIAAPYSNYWLYFIDDVPNSYWKHDCRYVFCNTSSASYSVTNYYDAPSHYSTALDSVSLPIPMPTFQTHVISGNHTILPNADINDGKYALLICCDKGELVKPNFWNPLSHTYCSLVEHGYKEDNIYAFCGNGTAASNCMGSLVLDGGTDDDIRKEVCSVANIGYALNSIRLNIKPSDVLYIYIICHGGPSGNTPSSHIDFALWDCEPLHDYDLANMLSGIDCSQIIVNIVACHSGGFADDFNGISTNAKKTLLTCVDSLKQYNFETQFASIAGMDSYSYLTCSSLRETYPCTDSVWIPSDSIGHSADFHSLFGKAEHDYDSLQHGGNQNGLHNIGETIAFASEYEEQFRNRGVKIYDCGFREDLLTLTGISGTVGHCQSVGGNFHIEGGLTISTDSLLLRANSNFYLFDADISISDKAKLVMANNTAIIAKTGRCRLVIDGTLRLGDHVTFRAEPGAALEVIFENGQPVDVSNATFENCTLTLPQGSITFDGCTFTGTPLTASVSLASDTVSCATISNCTFMPGDADLSHAIMLSGYPFYRITQCSIARGEGSGQFMEGISLHYSGNFGATGARLVSGNDISACSDAGLLMYSTTGSITMNQIYDNQIGVKLLNNSNIRKLSGLCSATADTLTQYIHDNSLHEIYATDNSLPRQFRYNSISHTGTTYWIKHEANVVYANPATDGSSDIDMRYNRWGNGFTPTTQLYTDSGRAFSTTPAWTLGNCYNENAESEALLALADSLAAAGDTQAARAAYRQVVEDYTGTTSAQSALMSMLAIEDDYEELQDYYLGDSTVANEATLARLASSLANKCDERLENYADAVAWYENVITDTATIYNDSLFARIDLMELNMEMAANGKMAGGKIGQMFPKSRETAASVEHQMIATLPWDEALPPSEPTARDDEYLPYLNLEAVVTNDTVTLYWDLPELRSSEIRLSWSSLNNGNSWATYDPRGKEFANRFDTTDIRPFVGWRVKDISVYTYNGSPEREMYKARMWIGDPNNPSNETYITELIYDSLIVNHQGRQWNTIVPDTNIYIPENSEFWIGYFYIDTLHGCFEYPYAVDDTPEMYNKGDLYRSNIYIVNEWDTFHYRANLMISATLENPDGKVETLSRRTSNQLTGFRIYRNGSLLADIPHPVQSYYTDVPNSNWTENDYCVVAVYDDEFESEPICLTALATADNTVDDLVKIYPNPATDKIRIEGAEIYEAQIYDNLGRLVGKHLGASQLDVSSYAPGVYTLKLATSKGQVVKRVVVE